MKNAITFFFDKLQKQLTFMSPHHHTHTMMAKQEQVFIKPSNFQTITLTFLTGRHI